jgi:hypothetical protein
MPDNMAPLPSLHTAESGNRAECFFKSLTTISSLNSSLGIDHVLHYLWRQLVETNWWKISFILIVC